MDDKSSVEVLGDVYVFYGTLIYWRYKWRYIFILKTQKPYK